MVKPGRLINDTHIKNVLEHNRINNNKPE